MQLLGSNGKATKEEILFQGVAGTWVVARRDYMTPSSKGGIHIPHSAMASLQKEIATGTCIAVGEGTNPNNGSKIPLPCSGGDRILWSRYAERVIQPGDDVAEIGDLVCMPFGEIVGVLK